MSMWLIVGAALALVLYYWGRSRRRPSAVEVPVSEQTPSQNLRCSFCEKAQGDVRRIIAGPIANICDECVDICVDIIVEERRSEILPQETVNGQPARGVDRIILDMTAQCGLCGSAALPDEMLTLEHRGILCGACVDAVEDALARWKPSSPES